MMFPSDLLFSTIVYVNLLSQRKKYQEKYQFIKSPNYEPRILLANEIPLKDPETTRFIIVSDTHNCAQLLGDLPKCDVFIHCGDITMTNRLFSSSYTLRKLKQFNNWLGTVSAESKFVIAGNHDSLLEKLGKEKAQNLLNNCRYLENEHINVGKIKIWATPYSSGGSKNNGFQSNDFLKKTIEIVPNTVDILLTHGESSAIVEKVQHKIHLWGHHHNSYGVRYPGDLYGEYKIKGLSICASVMDGRYNLNQAPIIIDLPNDPKNWNFPSQEKTVFEESSFSIKPEKDKEEKARSFFSYRKNKILPS